MVVNAMTIMFRLAVDPDNATEPWNNELETRVSVIVIYVSVYSSEKSVIVMINRFVK